MVKIIMHGCNGHMGQVISEIVEKDPNAQIVAGIDIADQGKNSYPVFTNIDECQVEADAVIDFSSPKAFDKLMDYCEKRNMPVVLCTTGLSEEQLARVEESAKKIAVLKSANMSLGINTLLKLVQEKGREVSSRFQGEVQEVLVETESKEKGIFTGRTQYNLLVHFPGTPDLLGKYVNVRLDTCKGFYYMGTRVED